MQKLNCTRGKAILLVLFSFAYLAQAQAQKSMKEFEEKMAKLRLVAEEQGTTLLPEITILFDQKEGVMLSWYNQYDYIKGIAVQRSNDSVKNYKTIAYLEKNQSGKGVYVDQRFLNGNSFYRLLVVFSSDLNWYSNMAKVHVDSQSFVSYYGAHMLNGGIPNGTDSLYFQDPSMPVANFTDPRLPNFEFRPSTTVYYDLFDKQIHVNLEPNRDFFESYQLVFKNPMNKKTLLKIDKLPKEKLLIDARNLSKEGLFEFEVYKAGKLKDKGFIMIQ